MQQLKQFYIFHRVPAEVLPLVHDDMIIRETVECGKVLQLPFRPAVIRNGNAAEPAHVTVQGHEINKRICIMKREEFFQFRIVAEEKNPFSVRGMTHGFFNGYHGLSRSRGAVYDRAFLFREEIQDSTLFIKHPVKHGVFQINIKSGRRKYVEFRAENLADNGTELPIRNVSDNPGRDFQRKQAFNACPCIEKRLTAQHDFSVRFRRHVDLIDPFIRNGRKPHSVQKFDSFRQKAEPTVSNQLHQLPFVDRGLPERTSRTHRRSVSVHPSAVAKGNGSRLRFQAQNSSFPVENDKIGLAFIQNPVLHVREPEGMKNHAGIRQVLQRLKHHVFKASGLKRIRYFRNHYGHVISSP